MRRFPKRYLLLSSIICLLFVSCRISKYNSLKNCQSVTLANSNLTPVIEKDKATKYKAAIDILSNHLSGIVIIKKTDSITTHIIFVTELGMKMFDFEMKDSIIKPLYVFEPLNKPQLVQMLTTSFKDIFLLDMYHHKMNSCTNKKSLLVYRYTTPTKDNYFFTTDSTGNLSLQEKFHKRKKANRILYDYDVQSKHYSQIKSIQYGLVKLKVELNMINN